MEKPGPKPKKKPAAAEADDIFAFLETAEKKQQPGKVHPPAFEKTAPPLQELLKQPAPPPSGAEGQLVYSQKEKIWVLDAEPQVVDLFSRLFPAANLYHLGGASLRRFTHRPRCVNDGIDARRNLDWFRSRFILETSAEDNTVLTAGTVEYESLRVAAEESLRVTGGLELALALPLRDYQLQGVSLFLSKKSLLIADQVGLGKTPQAIAGASKHLPALVVVPPHLVTQWQEEIKKFIPHVKTHIIYGRKNYPLPAADFYITGYSRIAAWADYFGPGGVHVETLILDEVHELRNAGTQKYEAVKSLAKVIPYRLGLSATPIFNYGQDVFNIFQLLTPNALGDENTFLREWCSGGGIRDPKLFGNFLRKKFMMLRRTRDDVALELPKVNRIVYTVDCDMKALQAMEKEASALAMTVLSGSFAEAGQAARELDWKLRHATGLSKAKSCAEIVKAVVASGEKVVLAAWHHDVYDIFRSELRELNPVFYTGSESVAEKQKALEEFRNGSSQVFVISLRSGSGINGLQDVCSHLVIAELDWSPAIFDQLIGRLWRDGQKGIVNAIFVVIADGSDPVMIETLGLKSSEARQVIDPKAQVFLANSDDQKITDMAKKYLLAHGYGVKDLDGLKDERKAAQAARAEKKAAAAGSPPTAQLTPTETPKPPPAPAPAAPGEEADFEIIDDPASDPRLMVFLRTMRGCLLSTNIEQQMQDELETLFTDVKIPFEREYVLAKDCRLDFLIGGDVVVECKVMGFKKRDLVRQLRRYIEAGGPRIKAVIIITPAHLKNFMLAGVPVYAVNASVAALIIDGLS